MSLIPYAGKPNPDHRRQVLAYQHFKLGRDTAAIAEMMRVPETTILRWITLERGRLLSLPNPYHSQGVAHVSRSA